MFFGDYRFSEDLDFSAQSAPKDRELESAIHQVVQRTAELLSEQGPFSVEVVQEQTATDLPGARKAQPQRHPGE